MRSFQDHLIPAGTIIREALKILDKLSLDAVLFVINEDRQLVGSLTDGDVRRGLIKGVTVDQPVDDVIQTKPHFIRKGEQDLKKVVKYREKNYRIIPVLDKSDRIVNIINFRFLKSYLPVDVVIMAGGEGTRLRPLTENVPKPLLKVGDKPVLEHNLNRLYLYGMDDFWISVNYLGNQIEDFFGDGSHNNVNIEYVREEKPLGTIGAVSKIDNFKHDYILITNSDILTNLNYEKLFLHFLDENADMAVVTIPYKVDIPYAVMETANGHVMSLKEKPTFTYYSNGGIYLMKREIAGQIPKNRFFDATDLMQKLINAGKKVISHPFTGYWLDIGKHEDLQKAQKDISSINF